MNEIKALIVDDEEHGRDIIKMLLKDDPEIEICGESESGEEAINAILTIKPELVFLDIQMPEIDGFDVIRMVGTDASPYFVFVTAYEEYALRAFDENAVDYLLKPYSDERFYEAVRRAKHRIQLGLLDSIDSRLGFVSNSIHLLNRSNIQKIPIKQGSKTSFVNIDEIDWIEADDQYVKIHLEKEHHLVRESMNNMEQKLRHSSFIRIHRSTIINTNRVLEVEPSSKGDAIVKLKSGVYLKISRLKREAFFKKLGW